MNAGDPPPLITECPNCHTRFRVGESQLQMAHGRVRCGACLAVFAGVDHLLLDNEAVPPELPSQANMLESVLAELAVEEVDEEAGSDQALSSARAFELDALATRRQDTVEIPARAGQSGVMPGVVAGEVSDWTAVTVDTQEFGRDDRLENVGSAAPSTLDKPKPRQSRVTIEDALDDEEALRWWLEDELPDDFAALDAEDDGMVVQLSQLDVVVDDDEHLDLQALIGAAEGDPASEQALAALFNELPDDPRRASVGAGESVALLGAKVEAKVPAKLAVPTKVPVPAKVKAKVVSSAKTKSADGNVPPTVQPADASSLALEASGEQSAAELQQAIDDAEPLVSRAMANGTIAAAAARIAAAKPRITPQKLPELAKSQPPRVPLATPELEETRAEKMATGQPEVTPQPNVLTRARSLINGFLGNVIALRAATVLAFVLLTGQIFYAQFEDWSKTATLRPVYASWCALAGCELPLRRSVRELQSRKLAVRSHPDKADALLVDVLIINEAEFEQPFPLIELQFMDMNQQIVGSYRLEPSAYLDGELAGSNALMAVRTPIHIDIDIPDPGPKAVNYQLQFR